MKLIILDFTYGGVDVINNVPEDTQDWEDFIFNTLKYKNSDVSGMLVEDTFPILVYDYYSKTKAKVFVTNKYLE